MPDQMSIEEWEQYNAKGRKKKTAPPLESTVQKNIIDLLLQRGWLVVRINGGGFRDHAGRYVQTYHIPGVGSAGHPDLVAYRHHGPATFEGLFIEVKRQGGKPRPSQLKFIRLANALNIPVHICDNWEAVEKLVSSL